MLYRIEEFAQIDGRKLMDLYQEGLSGKTGEYLLDSGGGGRLGQRAQAL